MKKVEYTMNIYQITFSPTGGTDKVASILSNVWEGQKRKIDLLKKDLEEYQVQLTPEDICIVAVPAYGGRVPGIAVEHLKLLKGNGAKAVLVAVYGNRKIDDTLVELQDVLEEVEFQCVAGIEAVAEHSLMRQFATGRPDNEDKKELEDFARQIKEMIKNDSQKAKLELPGNHPYREFGGVPFKPIVGRKCNNCGLCVKECPVGAISKVNPKELDKEKCISCMHCQAICPKKARKLNKWMLFVASKGMKKVCSGRKENKIYL